MGVVYQVRHETRYRYGATVDVAAHMLHLLPRALPWQRVLSSAIITDPPVERCVDGRDHFGNQVTWLFMHRPHADFTVTLEARVVVSAGLAPVDAGPAWEDVAALMRARAAWREAEFVFASQHAPADRAAAAWASLDFPPSRPILEGLRALNRRFSDEFRFRPGVTEVNTPVAEVLRRREGVCQDFSHLMIAALRGLGLPARYVSGYVRTRPPPGQPARRGADQSHAWVEAWAGPSLGWIGLDPTNGIEVREEHVLLAWGRDFSDVSPVRGVILGGGEHGVLVSVDLAPAENEQNDNI